MLTWFGHLTVKILLQGPLMNDLDSLNYCCKVIQKIINDFDMKYKNFQSEKLMGCTTGCTVSPKMQDH